MEARPHGRTTADLSRIAPYQLFAGYRPSPERPTRSPYRLIAGEFSGVESIVARPFTFRWTLELSDPPWPADLRLPYEVPQVFYGGRVMEG